MNTSSAKIPGKVILIGEHAVVHGFPAITSTLNLYATCRIKKTKNSHVRIIISRFNFEDGYSWGEIKEFWQKIDANYKKFIKTSDYSFIQGNPKRTSGIALIALQECVSYFKLKNLPGMTIHGDSDIPVGGFGSSSAAGAAVIVAFLKLMDIAYTKEDVFKILYNTESKLFGTVSGVDQTTVLHEGLIEFKKGENRNDYWKLNIKTKLLKNAIIVDTGRPKNTTGEVVEHVKAKKLLNPNLVGGIFNEIGQLTEVFKDSLRGNNKKEFFDAVKRSGQLLIELGIVSKDVQRIVKELEAEGAYTKISGAGTIIGKGSGSLLVFSDDQKKIEKYLKKNKFNYFVVDLG
jgi:hydroxymethylglutaryl-CoA synthase